MVTVNRTADHFRDHVISGAERDRAEPKKEQIIRVPPADRRLHHALDRDHEEHCLRGGVKPRKPEERAEQIPLGDINLVAATKTEHQDRPRNNQRVSDKKNNRGIRRKLEPVVTSAVAHENSDYANQHTNVPKPNPRHNEQRMSQSRPAQSRHQPDRRSHCGHRRPAVNHHVHVHRTQSAPRQKADIREPVG